MVYENRVVPLDLIDQQDDTYRITKPGKDFSGLLASVSSVGLINPPVVFLRPDGLFCIVAGFGRVLVCRELQYKEMPVRVLSACQENKCGLIAVADNASCRELSVMEQARALCLIVSDRSPKEELPAIQNVLGTAVNPKMIKKIQSLASAPLCLGNALEDDRIALAVALELVNMPHEHIEAFCSVFGTMKMSLNKQRDVVRMVTEIAARDKMDIADVLSARPVAAILSDDKTDTNRKAHLLRTCLRQMRYPVICRVQEEFFSAVTSLKLPCGADWIPPADFEGTVHTLRMRFSSREELLEKQQACMDAVKQGDTRAIFFAGIR